MLYYERGKDLLIFISLLIFIFSFFPVLSVHECNLLAATMWVFDEQTLQGKVKDYPVNQAVGGRSTPRNFGQGYTSGLSEDII